LESRAGKWKCIVKCPACGKTWAEEKKGRFVPCPYCGKKCSNPAALMSPHPSDVAPEDVKPGPPLGPWAGRKWALVFPRARGPAWVSAVFGARREDAERLASSGFRRNPARGWWETESRALADVLERTARAGVLLASARWVRPGVLASYGLIPFVKARGGRWLAVDGEWPPGGGDIILWCRREPPMPEDVKELSRLVPGKPVLVRASAALGVELLEEYASLLGAKLAVLPGGRVLVFPGRKRHKTDYRCGPGLAESLRFSFS